jgi:hypothetical protein
VSPMPTAMVLESDPGAHADLALHDLLAFILAGCDFATGPVVGRDFCLQSVRYCMHRNVRVVVFRCNSCWLKGVGVTYGEL